ncbi:hypothetical protein Ddye_000675 [Dipteronia dyeriana]|uniref:Ferric reductase NAD binding domain-containing protein n=1 Tax=Dipteronia dyeriana TaxID=168575 RepID=A0AAD9XM36_9ROSI|nr:hypothetical protein Ddye_000675 [Dipteronia dyeriana]
MSLNFTIIAPAFTKKDTRSVFIAMIQPLYHSKKGSDIVSGTGVKSHFGKPNLQNMYKRVSLRHTNTRVGMFNCGPPALMKKLRQLALEFSQKTTTKFDFHQEYI